jgi:hypothetical protein
MNINQLTVEDILEHYEKYTKRWYLYGKPDGVKPEVGKTYLLPWHRMDSSNQRGVSYNLITRVYDWSMDIHVLDKGWKGSLSLFCFQRDLVYKERSLESIQQWEDYWRMKYPVDLLGKTNNKLNI